MKPRSRGAPAPSMDTGRGRPDSLERVALKIQRRRYAMDAVQEISVFHALRRADAAGGGLIEMHDAFLHDGHVCIAFEKHGRSLSGVLDRGPLPPARARRVVRRMLEALAALHRCGYAHTDVKPGNILYDARTGEARLADLGLADDTLRQGSRPGTRDYLAPEILLGAPLSTAVDLWSLGCTTFELLTGTRLFQSRRAAARKYREFATGRQALAVPMAERAIADKAEARAEQYAPGAVIAGKYRLLRQLGRGTFGTVWEAARISDAELDGAYATLWGHAQKLQADAPVETERDEADRAWRRAKGANDLLELALYHQLIQLQASLCGPFPESLIGAGFYRASYFEPDGRIRFHAKTRLVSLRERLRRGCDLRGPALGLAADFIGSLLRLDPAARAEATAALAHPWLGAVRLPHEREARKPRSRPRRLQKGYKCVDVV